MSIKVMSPGLLTTIQDYGRLGFAEYGVPKSGAMDAYAVKIANMLVGDSEEEAVMEITMLGPELEFQQNAFVALSGLKAEVFLNGESVDLNTAFRVKKNDRLKISQITKGVRIYLAVNGGFLTERVLGSRSFYGNITTTEKLKKGDNLPIAEFHPKNENKLASVKFESEHYESPKLTVFKGPEWENLSETLKEGLLKKHFTVSKNNSRMAYQLKETFQNELKPILTQPVLPGTVQLTPGGNLIILMRDCQTTGGYPRIFQLDDESINRLAQKREGDGVGFELDYSVN